MSIPNEKSLAAYQAARALMLKGVSSNARSWGEGKTLFVSRAKGAYLWDLDGNRYIDYRLAFGPIILGYANDDVDAEVRSAMQRGVGSGLTSEIEIRAAGKIVEMCPGIEKVRFVNSGTEAAMHAIRLARAFTGREKILKFEGGYHGANDYVLFSTYTSPEAYGSQTSPIAIPASSGIPRALQDLIITAPFNNRGVLEKMLCDIGRDVAAIITEPMLGNFGCVEAQPGFLEFIRSQCDKYGIVLILDEVKTGFRVARGGAQELHGIQADLVTYAKAMGNGYPVAAYGGRTDIMEMLGEGVSQGGTFSGNLLSVAAADATLGILKSGPVLEKVAQSGRWLQDGIKSIFNRLGIRISMSGYPAIFGVGVGAEEIIDARDWTLTDRSYYRRFAALLLERGVLIDPDPREPWCLCYSHTPEDVERSLEAIEDAATRLRGVSGIVK